MCFVLLDTPSVWEREMIMIIISSKEELVIEDLDIDCSIVSYGQGVGIVTYC